MLMNIVTMKSGMNRGRKEVPVVKVGVQPLNEEH